MLRKMCMNVVFLCCVVSLSAVGALNYPPLAGAQGIDSYTKLMLHADGTDQGTAFTDSSSGAKTVTNTESYDTYTKLMLHMENNLTDSAAGKTVTNNNVTFTNSVYKMGGYSGVFNGNNGMSFRPLGAYVFLLFNFRGLHPLLYSDGLSGLKYVCCSISGSVGFILCSVFSIRPEGQKAYSQG